MATFTDSIKILLNLEIDKSAKGGLKTIKDDIDKADGSFNKLKTGASGAFDFVKQNATGFALGAGTAIGAFAVSAINDFQDVALQTGELSDALGISAEEASRWVEVAGDLGIGVDTVQSAMGKMLKVAGSTPEVFDQLGVSIARAKDGSVDANGTFLNVIDRLNGMKDPAERAAAAQKLLGKSWQESAELIGLGADGVKAKLDEVSGAKIITDDQIGEARGFRDAMDNLADMVDEVKLQLAEQLIPTLTSLAEAVGPVVNAFGKFRDVAETIGDIPVAGFLVNNFIHPLDKLKSAVGLAGDAWDAVFGDDGPDISPETQAQVDAVTNSIKATIPTLDQLRDAYAGVKSDQLVEAAARSDAVKVAAEAAAAAEKAFAEQAEHVAEIMLEQADALNTQVDAMTDSADATLAANDAQAAFAEAAIESNRVQSDAASTSEEKTRAVESERDALINAAKAQQEASQKTAESQGVTQSATSKVDSFNSSLLANANYATPAARNAIADYINQANAVPAEKATAIKAAIAAGDFETAKRLLDEASRARTAAIQADANTTAAERELNNVARDRQSTIQVRTISNGVAGPSRYAKGGRVGSNGGIGGEAGAELVEIGGRQTIIDQPTGLPPGALVTPLSSGSGSGSSAAGGSGFGGGGGTVFAPTININTVAGDPFAIQRMVVDALTSFVRSNGPAALQRVLKVS